MKAPWSPSRTSLTIALLLLHAVPAVSGTEKNVPVATTLHFAFFSDFATNLNDALIVAGCQPGMRAADAPFGGFFAEEARLDYWEGE